jgi:hypothetical protein
LHWNQQAIGAACDLNISPELGLRLLLAFVVGEGEVGWGRLEGEAGENIKEAVLAD